jgi:hypothetical protein
MLVATSADSLLATCWYLLKYLVVTSIVFKAQVKFVFITQSSIFEPLLLLSRLHKLLPVLFNPNVTTFSYSASSCIIHYGIFVLYRQIFNMRFMFIQIWHLLHHTYLYAFTVSCLLLLWRVELPAIAVSSGHQPVVTVGDRPLVASRLSI